MTATSNEEHKKDFCMWSSLWSLDEESESENRECETPSLDRLPRCFGTL